MHAALQPYAILRRLSRLRDTPCLFVIQSGHVLPLFSHGIMSHGAQTGGHEQLDRVL